MLIPPKNYIILGVFYIFEELKLLKQLREI